MGLKGGCILLAVIISAVVAFVNPQAGCSSNTKRQETFLFAKSFLDQSLGNFGQIFDQIATSLAQNPKPQTSNVQDRTKCSKLGRVTRVAARQYAKEASTPSSREYTTRKNGMPSVTIATEGVVGDYNHYRTTALKSTPNRAISILTTDAMKFLRSKYPSSQDGDLGENILVDGIEYRSFRVGDKVSIGEQVVLEITEPIEPCANLCKLSYINDEKLAPKKRIERCRQLIESLDLFDGLRGWYAKVVSAGVVRLGEPVKLAAAA